MNIVGPPLGRIAIVPEAYPEWNINQALAIFRAKEGVLPLFLFYALRSPLVLPSILRLPVGVRQLNISLEQCRNLLIPVPEAKRQAEFVALATRVRAIENRQIVATGRAEATFAAILARAFGRTQAATPADPADDFARPAQENSRGLKCVSDSGFETE